MEFTPGYFSFLKGVIVIGKIMILSFSDDEEHIIDKLKSVFEDESNLEYSELMPRTVLSFKDIEIQLKERTVYREGKRIPLSNQEFLILHFLAEHPGWVYTKEQIYSVVCNDLNTESIDNSIYCVIRSLRKKLEKDPKRPEYIRTVKGVGYKFTNPGE